MAGHAPQTFGASTPQRVHLERGGGGGGGDLDSGLQPHNGFIWNHEEFNPGVGSTGLQPHNGFIWNTPPAQRGPTAASGFNPTTGSSGTSNRPRRDRHRHRASTPQRVHLERRFRHVDSVHVPKLQPHNGFIWNEVDAERRLVAHLASTPQRVHLERGCAVRGRLSSRFNPTTGSSGTGQ